jgi:hypothetical protein
VTTIDTSMRVPGEVTEAALTGSFQKSGIPLIGDSVNGPPDAGLLAEVPQT